PTRFIENSPVFMADRVKTPLLMLHNDRDEAVPWYQGIEYYLALRRLGKEAYLFNYPGEAHGLRRRANQKDYTIRLQQFFDHHLKGAPKPEWMAKGIPYRAPEGERPRRRPGSEGGAVGKGVTACWGRAAKAAGSGLASAGGHTVARRAGRCRRRRAP